MPKLQAKTILACVLVGLLGIAGCASDDSTPSSSPASSSSSGGTTATGGTTYKGTFAGAGGDGGSIEVTVAGGGASTKTIHPLAIQQVTGTLHVSGGGSITITGTFDDETKQLSITGGGYSFTGAATSDGVSGTYTGPKGSGSFTVFASATATPYCGTFAGDASGVWNFVVDEGKLSGSAVTNEGDTDAMTGTVTDGTVTMTTTNGTIVDGKIEGTAATGTWKSSGGSQGTWTGTAGCGG